MLIPRCVVCIFSVGLATLGAGAVIGQDYPNKPIRVVTSAAGGGTDFLSRLIAQELTASLGKQVIVDNRGSMISAEIVVKAPPDGYTLLIGTDLVWIAPLMRNTSYDPIKDLSSISLIASAPLLLVVHPSLPVKSVKELIDLAKSKPGVLNSASSTKGTPIHLAAELFKSMAGAEIVIINYKGTAPALNALIGTEVHFMFGPAGTVIPHVKSGRLRALAVTSTQPSMLGPGLPTMAASGLSGYEVALKYAVFAPPKTPTALISRLSREVVTLLNQASIKERLLSAGGVETVASSPEQLVATIRSDMAKLGKVIRDAGIRDD